MKNVFVRLYFVAILSWLGSYCAFACESTISNEIHLEDTFKIVRRGDNVIISDFGNHKSLAISSSGMDTGNYKALLGKGEQFPIAITVGGKAESLTFYYNAQVTNSGMFNLIKAKSSWEVPFFGGNVSCAQGICSSSQSPIFLINKDLTLSFGDTKIQLVEDDNQEPITIGSKSKQISKQKNPIQDPDEKLAEKLRKIELQRRKTEENERRQIEAQRKQIEAEKRRQQKYQREMESQKNDALAKKIEASIMRDIFQGGHSSGAMMTTTMFGNGKFIYKAHTVFGVDGNGNEKTLNNVYEERYISDFQ